MFVCFIFIAIFVVTYVKLVLTNAEVKKKSLKSLGILRKLLFTLKQDFSRKL